MNMELENGPANLLIGFMAANSTAAIAMRRELLSGMVGLNRSQNGQM